MTGEERWVETGVPGAVTSVIDLEGGVLAELNGTGSIVAYVYPNGFDEEPESPAELVDRLAAELKDARKALKASLA